MSARTCRYFDNCSAPICPEDPPSMANCAWFPEEATCTRADLKMTPWIVNQRRIARATCRDFVRGCFTAEMLAGITKITRAVKGLDPDDPITTERVKKWLSGYKGKKVPLTDAQRAELRVRGFKKGPRKRIGDVLDEQPDVSRETLVAETMSVEGVRS